MNNNLNSNFPEKVWVVVGNKQWVSDAISFVLTAMFSAALVGFGLLSKLPAESQLIFGVAAGVPMWFLSSGILEAIGASFTTDKERQEHSGYRVIFGAAKAVSALLLLLAGAIYIWLR